MLEKLRAGELDLGILALPVELAGLEARELYREAFMVALPERHPLAARAALRVADLKGETLLLLEDGHCLRDQALEVCSRVGVQRAAGLSRDEPRDAAADGGHRRRRDAAARSSPAAAPTATRAACVLRPFARPAPVRHIGAVWRKTHARGAPRSMRSAR